MKLLGRENSVRLFMSRLFWGCGRRRRIIEITLFLLIHWLADAGIPLIFLSRFWTVCVRGFSNISSYNILLNKIKKKLLGVTHNFHLSCQATRKKVAILKSFDIISRVSLEYERGEAEKLATASIVMSSWKFSWPLVSAITFQMENFSNPALKSAPLGWGHFSQNSFFLDHPFYSS